MAFGSSPVAQDSQANWRGKESSCYYPDCIQLKKLLLPHRIPCFAQCHLPPGVLLLHLKYLKYVAS